MGWDDWHCEPTVTVGLIAVAVLYGAAVRARVIRRDDDVSHWFSATNRRPVFFGAGLAVAAIALLSPIDEGGDQYLFALHMTQHLLLMMIAPPLALLGIVGAARLRVLGGEGPRVVRTLWRHGTRLWTAAAFFTGVMLVWHIPTLYNATLTAAPVHIVEHLTFVIAGVVFWWPIVDPMRTVAGGTSTAMSKVAMLVISGLPPTALGFIFAVARRPLYDFYEHAPRLWGVSAVTDQQIAGVLMFGVGNLIYFAAISLIFHRMAGNAEDDERLAQGVRARV